MKAFLTGTVLTLALAGTAFADVRLSGYGRFGLDYNDGNGAPAAPTVSENNITSRLRLQIDMSTETDGGVTLGARTRIQSESRDGVSRRSDFNGARFYATVGGFTLGIGNIIGAIENTPGLYLPTRSAGTGIDGSGFFSLPTNVDRPGTSFFNWDAYDSTGAGRNGIEVIYSVGDFSVHASVSNDNTGPAEIDRTAAHVAYTFGDWTAALGIQDSDVLGEDKALGTLTYRFDGFDLGLAAARNYDASGPGRDVDKVRVYGSADIGAASRLVVWAANEDNPGTPADGTSYGLDFGYDLGGGATFVASTTRNSFGQTQVQSGVYFDF